jgi:hypothetical protein
MLSLKKREIESPQKDSSKRALLHSVNRDSMFEDQIVMGQRPQQWLKTELASLALVQTLIAQRHGVSDLIVQGGMHEELVHGVSKAGQLPSL